MLSDKKAIFQTLRYSIRKIDEDEIEIRHSLMDGYIRLFFRFCFIAYLGTGMYFDTKHNRPAFTFLHRDIQAIQEDFTWAFNPDKRIRPAYKDYIQYYDNPQKRKEYPESYPLLSYEEFRTPYVTEDFWKRHKAYIHFFWIPFVFCLIFLPKARGLHLNRKYRMIYTAVAAVPVPDMGDPHTAPKSVSLRRHK